MYPHTIVCKDSDTDTYDLAQASGAKANRGYRLRTLSILLLEGTRHRHAGCEQERVYQTPFEADQNDYFYGYIPS